MTAVDISTGLSTCCPLILSDMARARFEREDDRRANNEAFTAALHHLFHILASWDVCRDSAIRFYIADVCSVSDHDFICRVQPVGTERRNLNGLRRNEDRS